MRVADGEDFVEVGFMNFGPEKLATTAAGKFDLHGHGPSYQHVMGHDLRMQPADDRRPRADPVLLMLQTQNGGRQLTMNVKTFPGYSINLNFHGEGSRVFAGHVPASGMPPPPSAVRRLAAARKARNRASRFNALR